MKSRNVEDVYPLSPAQEGILFHSLYEPESGFYVKQMSCPLHGPLDLAALERAWRRVVERHTILRTSFVWKRQQRPLQVVHREVALPFAVHDWRGEPGRWEAFLEEDLKLGFDPSRPPLMRLAVVRTGEETHQLLWTAHHLLLDGWSLPLVLGEVFQLYTAFQAGGEPALPPARPYGDFVAWLQRQDLARAEAFWRQALGGFSAPTPLPGVWASNGHGVGPLGVRRSRLGAAATAALQALAQRNRLTLSTLVQGAWGLLLGRYTDQPEVVFGIAVSGRPADLTDAGSMVGPFLNTVPVRMRVEGGEPLLPWLSGLQRQILETQAYEHSPLVLVQGWSEVPRGTALFESLLVFENYPASALAAEGNGLRPGGLSTLERTNYPLTLSVVPGEELAFRLAYDSHRFEEEAAGRLLDHLHNVLEGMAAAGSTARLADLPLLGTGEAHRMLVDWNGSGREVPGVCAHTLIEERAALRPDAPAVLFGEEVVSYCELDRRATALAHRLRAAGAGPESVIGLAVERSPAMLVSMLAVWKSGAAYVPLDLAQPRERLVMILEDAPPAVLLTERALLSSLPVHDARIVLIDGLIDGEEAPVSGGPLPQADPGNLAYVLFTSGSTGRPKGVQISHRSLVNFLASMREEPGLGEDDVLLAVTTLSFDIAALELILPLTVGARVAVATRDEAADASRLQALLASTGATVLQATPSTWRMLLDAGWNGDRRLRAFCGGEALPAALAVRLLPGVAELWNLYGPTETTIWSAVRQVGAGEEGPTIAIGQPVANTRLYLLGRDGNPVPMGAAGELWIGGAGLARGYLGLPGLSADRFRPDPFGGAGERLYRTGDLARRLPDGRIEFLGRLDHQVKIRGFRIELGEIESALEAHPGIRQAVVVARETAAGDRSLVAYVTGTEAELPAAVELRAFLRGRLPDFMVPSRFVAIDAMPLTPSGKVDRRALPAPDETVEATAGAAPRDPVEEILAGLWRDLLGRGEVGIHDDFFELGGHSLTATQLASKLWQTFGVELPVRRLFEAPTIARLADVVRAARRSGEAETPLPLVPISRDGELPLSFAQVREWFLDQMEPGSPAYDIPHSLRLRGRLRIAEARLALDEIVRRHESLRTAFPAHAGRPVQVIVPSLDLAWPLVDLAGLPETALREEARRLAAEHAVHSFDLARGPLLRATFLRLREEEHLLLLNVHHIVSDDWSLGVLVGELGTLYSDFVSGRPSSLPPLPVQYVDFAAWQHARLQGSALDAQLAYWRRHLGGDRPPLDLAPDRPRPALRSFQGAEVPFVLSGELSRQVAGLASGVGTSVFMAVLSAFQALLHRRTGERDVSVGTFVANRDRTEIEPLIGFFVNTLVLRSRPEPGTPFRDFLKAVREVCLDAYSHRDVPFERLLEDLQPERQTSHAPLFQVMLVFQNAPAPAVELPGLEMEPLHVETARSDFDLTLWMWQDREGRLAGTLNYATDLFHRTTALRMVEQLRSLLAGAAADPGRTLGELPLLSGAEAHQVLVEWNDTAAAGGPPEPVHRLVAAVAARTPGAVAVVSGGQELTYGELEDRANRLARRLRRLGVGPDSRVALCVERSLDMIVGLLAVLKAGGGYVPLDPAYPRERLALLLADSGVAVVLAQRRTLEALPADIQALLLDEVEEERTAAPEDHTAPESLAYVIYTSGSTGRPRGVLVPHGALAAHTRAAVAHHGIRLGDRVLQFASISFDASAEEIYPCLAAGATLVLRDESMLGSLERFAEACRELGITVLDLPTAYWHELAGVRLPESVRLVILGGEKALAERWAQWRESGATARLVNTYGPTEATIVATLADLGRGDGEAPIGRPIAGVRAFVLDAEGRPQPIGVPGELRLGGPGLARGYLGDPASTAARFVPDPFGAAGARLYRTGDLVRWRGDGELEFLGRVDAQVKIRGFRVEPGEIEAALASHPGIREAAVVARDGRLVAYAVAAMPEIAPSSHDLRAWLEARLPRHLVPSAFVPLDALPRTAAGKVDRRGLPAPEFEIGSDHVPAATPTEEMLASIWSEVLGVERVGVRDNFFDLGGHSLVATQIMARVQELFQVDLPLRALFEAPTVERLAVHVEEAGRRPVLTLRRVPRDRDLPLSFSQERLWFLSRLDPESTSYFVPRALRLTGRLDVAALEKAYAALLERHEILRTRFPEVDGRPVQRIEPPGPFPLPRIELRGLPDGLRQEEEGRLILDDGARLFDVEAGALIRASLLHVADGEWVAVQTEHHLVHDGWTEAVLLRDLLGLYQAFAERREPDLPELPVQFADFAVWQREWLQGEVLEEQLAWWKERMAGAPPVLELPTDRPRPLRPSFRGEAEDVLISRERVARLRALGRREGATLFMTVLAVFEVLLLRLSGQDDLVVGTGVANRRQRETEGMLGMVINTLALRTDASGDPTFLELLRRVRETCLGAYAHQDLPFDRVVEALNPERTPSHAPVFQVMFAFHDARFPEVSLPGLEVRSVMRHNRSAKFDLVLILTPYPEEGTLGVHTEYSTDLFEAATVRRFLDRFETLLDGVVAEPGAHLSDLLLLTTAELAALAEWNDTRSDYPREACLPELFGAVTRELPEAPAIVAGDDTWTYRRLDEESGRLAGRLRSLGIGLETAVGVALEGSPELVVAILAVLKAGGTYVPLDPGYPDERLDFLLADTGAQAVMVDRRTEERLAGRARLIRVDQGGDGEAVSARVPAEAMACVIYTSGSTGRPKGVAVTHRGIARLVRETSYLSLGPGDRVAQAGNVSFDALTYELWAPLLNGAAVVLVPREATLSPADLSGLLRERRVTSMFLTTSLFAKAVREVPGAFETLDDLLVGGEALDPSVARQALADRPPRRLINIYGPTETTTYATWHPVLEIPEGVASVPIGHPISNTTVHLLDRWHALVPLGAAGEVCIGGDGVARGYVNRPDLTALRFIPDPWGDGDRLYRTGDLARRRPDGTIEFLGRLDDQVKIRGFRIEPGEVEAVLAAHPAVRQCAVVVRRDAPGGARLVAYTSGAVRSDELRRYLQERLPDYMMPSEVVLLEELPLNPNGKVDRKALPAPERTRTVEETSAALAGPVEELMARIWEELLGRAPVAALDDFFELGGHSLLATQVASRVRAVFGVDLPLRTLFESPRLRDLAAAVDRLLAEGAGAEAPPLEKMDRNGYAPLSFAQQRLWFLHRLEPESPTYHIGIALRLSGPLHVPALAVSLAEIERRHEALRTVFLEVDGEPVQRVVEPSWMPLVRADLDGLPEDRRASELDRLAAAERARPFDLGTGPLWRCLLVRLGEEEHAAVFTLHHIVADGWSLGVLVRELAGAYPELASGRRPVLPELPVQYPDFALWQRSWLRGEALERRLAWWRERLAGTPPVLELPADRPRPAFPSGQGAARWIVLPRERSAEMGALARRQGATKFMVLLAAWKALLHRYTGETDLSVGTPIANRNRAETEGLVGFFVNTLVLRTRVDGDLPFSGLTARVRETALGAFAHQDMPFERLVEELSPERSLAHAPLFQVMFSLQNAPLGRLELPGLRLEPLPIEQRVSHFDLTLSVEDDILRLEFNRDLFEDAAVDRMLGHLGTLLAGALADPSFAVAELPLLTPAEEHQLLAMGQGPALESGPACLHELFEAQARRTPDAPAVRSGMDVLSYAELYLRAGLLARRLRRLGVGPDVPVGVCLERSPDLLVALLGVLKAGGAYLPLDPKYPRERLDYLLEDSGAPVVITEERLAFFLRDEPGEESPAVPVPPESLAWIIYTSGSTGRPKGVGVSHAAGALHLAGVVRVWQLGPGDRVLQTSSPSFDMSLEELLPALLAGATVVFRPDEEWEPERFLERISESGVTVLNLATAYLKPWVRELAGSGRPTDLRLVATGGESLPTETARLWLDGPLGDVPLLNGYGPTEAVVSATFPRVERVPESASVPVGRPLAGRTAHVLDRGGRLVPMGVPGELCLGGPLLARGYLGQPERTADRFVPDPFSGEPGARLYRTGDLARLLIDGELDILGRIDQQVKVRGFRIETGEIEAALARHPGVLECTVAAWPDARGDLALVAYTVSQAEPGELRDFLRRTLPEPMIPQAWVRLERMPLTPGGKLDRKALPRPAAECRTEAAAVSRTPVEEILAGIWAELLGVDPAGLRPDDHFFELGGHSLLATQVVSRVRSALGVELALRSLFERPTLAELASGVEEALRAGRGLQAPPLVRRERPAELPLSFAQQRLWFLEQLDPGSAAYHIPVALHVRGRLDVEVLRAALDQVVRRHEALRTTFDDRGGRPLQVIHPPQPMPLPVVNLGGLPADRRQEEAGRLGTEEAVRPFSLSDGPLLRVGAVRLGPDEHVVLFTMHHIVGDGWSLDLLVREVTALHGAFSEGRPSALPELPVQYADFSEWQREWLQGEALETLLFYWSGQLEGAPMLQLPTDRPRPAQLSPRGATWHLRLPAGLSEALRKLALGSRASLFMTLLAGFEALLHRASGQLDLVLGSDVANRNRTETEGLVGFFVNQLVLRTRLSAEPTFRELLAEIRETVLAAHLHQDLPFERLVEELRIERDLSRNPLFQTVFALNGSEPPLVLPGLSVEPWPLPQGTAKYDLLLSLTDRPEGLAGGFQYSTDLFDAPTIGRMAAHLEILLQAIVADPERRLADLPLLAEAERHQLLAEWNDSSADTPEAMFPALFEAQAARMPDRTAVVCRGESLTYRELDERAGRAAAFLVEQGVGPDTVVALLAERGIDFLIAVLAVFKAGGAYLPLDPYHPAARHAHILERSGGRLFDVAELARVERAPIPSGRQLPAHLAYVIYTSGSTGEPKGVMIEQRGMVNHLRAKLAALDLGPDDAVAQNASQCFDISVWQLLAALLVGGRVHIVPDEVALDAAELLRLLERERITVFETVPSMLRALLDRLETQPADLSALRWLIPTGEALPPDLCRRWLGLHPGIPLVNAYGPTECSDDVTHHIISQPPAEGTVPIGRPVPNLRIHLLDRDGNPVPAGVPGELFVGGAGLGRGYLGDPALTAAAFVPDPLPGKTGEPGARLYRSGDLARQLPDGTLEFLGRIDHQVKVRGFRIELGEIETALARHPEVREAVAVAREEPSGDRRLVAYVVPRTGEDDASREMSQWQAIFDETYAAEAFSRRDPRLNLKLWTSSYTGRSLEEDEIFECVDDSAARILALKPRRVLEIGCGTGLLLFRVAPECEAYWGTDFSPAVLEFLRKQIDGAGIAGVLMPDVRLLQRRADDLSEIPEGAFDTVVINEVSQYFPGADYLVRVLEAACRMVRPGGSVFVGGVRNLPLLEAFHASVELERASPFLTVEELRERVRRRLSRDKELAVAPELFAALARRHPRISGAEVRLKGGRHRNELVKFRYDVVLRVEGEERQVHVPASDWQRDGWSLDALRERLETGPEAVAIGGIPNARVAFDTALVAALPDHPGHAADLRETVRGRMDQDAVDPQALWDLGRELGYEVEAGWTRSTADGSFNAIFRRPGAAIPLAPEAPAADRPWSEYANSPLQGYLGGELSARLREDLAGSLPDYMVPAALVVLDALPLTPNGKVDRKALPEPDRERPELRESYLAPRDEVEERLAGIWREILGVDRVGVRDSFFDLGGHSLLATQVLSRIRDAFQREVSLREIFDQPTVEHLAGLLRAAGGTPETSEAPRLERAARDRFRTRRKALDENA